jgi:hypothetical protein
MEISERWKFAADAFLLQWSEWDISNEILEYKITHSPLTGSKFHITKSPFVTNYAIFLLARERKCVTAINHMPERSNKKPWKFQNSECA